MTHPSICESPEYVRKAVTIYEDAYTATKGTHAIVLCTEWDEFVVCINYFTEVLHTIKLSCLLRYETYIFGLYHFILRCRQTKILSDCATAAILVLAVVFYLYFNLLAVTAKSDVDFSKYTLIF